MVSQPITTSGTSWSRPRFESGTGKNIGASDSSHQMTDEAMMVRCIELSRIAVGKGEYPVGTVIAYDGNIVAEAINRTVRQSDVSRHAEVIALSQAHKMVGREQLRHCTLYTNIEPCAMCSYCIREAWVGRVVYALGSPVMGGLSKWNILRDAEMSGRMPQIFGLSPWKSRSVLRPPRRRRPLPEGGLRPACVHSHYRRRVADLPLAGRSVQLVLVARRFRCDAVLCGRQIFTERFADGVVASSARRTARLDCIVHHLGLALGGRTGGGFCETAEGTCPCCCDRLLAKPTA